MGSRELSEWIAYDQIEPLGSLRDDIRAGMIASPLVNMQISKGKKTEVKDWILKMEREEQSPDDMKMLLQGIAKEYERREKRSRRREG